MTGELLEGQDIPQEVWDRVTVQPHRDFTKNGIIVTNAAMVIGSYLKIDSKRLADDICELINAAVQIERDGRGGDENG